MTLVSDLSTKKATPINGRLIPRKFSSKKRNPNKLNPHGLNKTYQLL